MANFAKLGLNSKVIKVNAVDDKVITDDNGNISEQMGVAYLSKLHGYPFWVMTDYEGVDRKHYAGIGFRYDDELDAFIPPKPYSSWFLNETTCNWQSPIDYPEDGKSYMWDEELQNWSVLEEQPTE